VLSNAERFLRIGFGSSSTENAPTGFLAEIGSAIPIRVFLRVSLRRARLAPCSWAQSAGSPRSARRSPSLAPRPLPRTGKGPRADRQQSIRRFRVTERKAQLMDGSCRQAATAIRAADFFFEGASIIGSHVSFTTEAQRTQRDTRVSGRSPSFLAEFGALAVQKSHRQDRQDSGAAASAANSQAPCPPCLRGKSCFHSIMHA